jgi:hypothetical protein
VHRALRDASSISPCGAVSDWKFLTCIACGDASYINHYVVVSDWKWFNVHRAIRDASSISRFASVSDWKFLSRIALRDASSISPCGAVYERKFFICIALQRCFLHQPSKPRLLHPRQSCVLPKHLSACRPCYPHRVALKISGQNAAGNEST